jgi:nitrite reductase/ring-hydroxylating ferredoxin subunit
VRLCVWSELVARGSLRVTHEGQALLIVRDGEAARAYLDQCPHTGQSLDGGEGGEGFLTPEGDALTCLWHGALFRLNDGFSFAGPCAGKALRPVAVKLENGWVVSG